MLKEITSWLLNGPAPPSLPPGDDSPTGELLEAPRAAKAAPAPASSTRSTKGVAGGGSSGGVVTLRSEMPQVARTDWNPRKAVEDGLKVCSWVYAAVTVRARFAASIPLKAQTRQGGRWVDDESTDHPFHRLVDEHPNPDMGRPDYIEKLAMDLDLGGEFYARIVEGTGKTQVEPVACWPFQIGTIEPVVNKRGEILGFYDLLKEGRFRRRRYVDARDIDYQRDEVVFGKYCDPSNSSRGLAPLKAIAWAVDTDVDSSRANRYVLKNAARPSGILSVLGKLDEGSRAHLEQQLNERVVGPQNAGKVALIGAETKLTRFGLSIEELMTLGLRKMTREEILAVYATPPPIVGLFERAIKSNMVEAKKYFYIFACLPLLGRILATHNRALGPAWGGDVRLAPDVSGIPELDDLDKDRVDNAVKLMKQGISFARVNRRFGLGFKYVPGDHIPYLPTSVQPVPEASPEMSGGDV